MKKIYLIQSALVDNDSVEDPNWFPLYAVANEDEARRDCQKAQIDADMNYKDNSFKFIYNYITIDLFMSDND